jgi:hypothetical protein
MCASGHGVRVLRGEIRAGLCSTCGACILEGHSNLPFASRTDRTAGRFLFDGMATPVAAGRAITLRLGALCAASA